MHERSVLTLTVKLNLIDRTLIKFLRSNLTIQLEFYSNIIIKSIIILPFSLVKGEKYSRFPNYTRGSLHCENKGVLIIALDMGS